MELSVLDETAASRTSELVRAYPFKPYRQYRFCSRQRQSELLSAEIDHAIAAGASIVAARSSGGSAALLVRPLPWDSQFFGVPMGRIDYLLREGQDPREALAAVIAAASDASRARGIRHLSARVDAADMDGIEALECQGYRLKDALNSYFLDAARAQPTDVRTIGMVRPLRTEDTEAVVDVAREAFRGFRSRFHLDRHLPPDRSEELYVEWARGCCSGEMADVAFVTENRHGQLVGFAAMRKVEPISTIAGRPFYGRALAGCRRNSPGTLGALVRAGLDVARERGGGMEIQTQNHNFPAVRVYEQIGFEYMRAEYTFHAWLGE